MLIQEFTLSSDGAESDALRLAGWFNIDITPSSDWSGELRIQYSFQEDQSEWKNEWNETDYNWGGETGRVVGLEHERGGVWYRIAIPAGGYTAGSIKVRFSQ